MEQQMAKKLISLGCVSPEQAGGHIQPFPSCKNYCAAFLSSDHADMVAPLLFTTRNAAAGYVEIVLWRKGRQQDWLAAESSSGDETG